MKQVGVARVFRIPGGKQRDQFAMLFESGSTICTCRANRRAGSCEHVRALEIYAELASKDAEKAQAPRKRNRRAKIHPVESNQAQTVSEPQPAVAVVEDAQG